jgi:hypothetical protein
VASGVRRIVAFLYESPFLYLEIYRLMTILESSSALADYEGTYEGDRRKVEYLRRTEFPEVSRIVISLAAIIRAAMDADPGVYAGDEIELEVERPVGVLMPDATRPDAWESLEFREACNKVIHAKRVDPKRTVDTGALTGELILHGDYRKKNWQARLELREFALAALSLTP